MTTLTISFCITCNITLYVNLCRSGVCSIDVGSKARVTPGVLLESFNNNQGVAITCLDNLNVW